MIKPVSLRLRHAAILRDARAALARAGREEELRRAHNTRVIERARATVARVQEQDRLRRCAKLAALKAIAAVRDAYGNISSSMTSEADREHWRERRELVERELQEIIEIVTKASR
jgi:hypothetical protein